MSPPNYIAAFDSASVMSLATAAGLRGEPFPALGNPPALKPIARRANLLPPKVRERLFVLSGALETVSDKRLDRLDFEEVGGWLSDEYPEGPYPAVAVGSSSGAMVHLYAALGIPWLPQTLLVPVRQRVHPDDPTDGDGARGGTRAADDGGQPRPAAAPHARREPGPAHGPGADLLPREAPHARRGLRAVPARAPRSPGDDPRRGLPADLGHDPDRRPPRLPARRARRRDRGGVPPRQRAGRGVPRALRLPGAPLGRPRARHREPRGRVGLRARALDDIERFADEHGYRVRGSPSTSPRTQPAGRRPVPLVVRARRIPAEPADRVELRRHGAVLDAADRLGAVLDEVQHGAVAGGLERYLDAVEPYDEIHLMLFQHGVERGRAPVPRRLAGVLRPRPPPGDDARGRPRPSSRWTSPSTPGTTTLPDFVERCRHRSPWWRCHRSTSSPT
jgi:hypothetical protein